MPTIQELFKTKVITEGPNAGKTAQDAYAIKNSKDLPIQSSNWFLKEINKNQTGGLVGKVINSFDFIEKINDRRKRYSIKDGESFVEQDQVGLKQFGITARPLLYGGDIFRISNQRTRTLSFIKKAANQNIGGGIEDKLSNALGNYAGDYVNNLLSGKSGKEAIPPKPDLVALGTELAVDIADRTLGALLPTAMVPSKVAEEIDKRGKKGQENYKYEYNRQKGLLELANGNKVQGFIKGLLKNNTNALSQSKDFLISTASSIVKSAIKAGATKLINKGVDALLKKKRQNLLGGVKATTGISFTPYSSEMPYSKIGDYDFLKPIAEQPGLKAMSLQRRAEFLKKQGVTLPASQRGFSPGADDTIPDNARPEADAELLDALNKVPTISKFNNIDSQFYKRGLTSRTDILNLSEDITYPGLSAVDEENNSKPFDDFDFIPLKFYSIANDKTIQFRCTVSELSETFTPQWDANRFIGNPFTFYSYQGIERGLTFSFKVYSLSLVEHQNAWQRLSELGKLTMPQNFRGASGAVSPPVLKFTLGNMYVHKDAIIDNLTFNVASDIPWEIGLNKKLITAGTLSFMEVPGNIAIVDPERDATGWKLPMIIDVEVSIKFLESRQTVENVPLYGYTFDTSVKSAAGANGDVYSGKK